MKSFAFLLYEVVSTVIVYVLICLNVAYWFLNNALKIAQSSLPDEIFSSHYTWWDSITEGMELNSLMVFQDLLT